MFAICITGCTVYTPDGGGKPDMGGGGACDDMGMDAGGGGGGAIGMGAAGAGCEGGGGASANSW